MAVAEGDRLRGITRFLGEIGYTGPMLRHDFPVWVNSHVAAADVVGFARAHPAPQDMTSAAVAGIVARSDKDFDRAFAVARALASPAAVIATDRALELWAIISDHHPARIDTIHYNEVQAAAERYQRELDPDTILAAKRATRQLSLFPVDVAELLGRARRNTASRLSARVDEAMGVALRQPPKNASEATRVRAVERGSRTIVTAMAALMVADKIEHARGDPAATLEVSRRRFPEFFAWTDDASPHDTRELHHSLELLGEGISYAGLDAHVVSHVYESSVVTAATRAKLGVFYTPPELAARILRQIPFEEFAPEDRLVVDPACGSGTFLITAYDRLEEIAPPNVPFVEQARGLAAKVVGFDADPFAVDIARLALLVNALPAGDDWQVTQRDALSVPTDFSEVPFVISNPPWRDIRSQQGHRMQVADAFVRAMLKLVAPGGHLALVLPANWLAAASSRATRQELQAVATIYEIWRLPEDTFSGAELAPVVVFAAKSPGRRPYVYRRMLRRKDWKRRFYEWEAAADEQVMSFPDNGLLDGSLLRGPLDHYAERLRELPRLSSHAITSTGPVPKPPVSERGGSGRHSWLRRHEALASFQRVTDHALIPIEYPDEFKWRGEDDRLYWLPKVLVSKVRKPDNPWRLKVLVDEMGRVVPRDSLFLVVPTHEVPSLYALTAVLGSCVAAAWIDSLVPSRSVPLKVMAALPVPASNANWDELDSLGRRVVRLAESHDLAREDLAALDKAVVRAYGLPNSAHRTLARHFAGFYAPDGIVRYELKTRAAGVRDNRQRRFPGAILDLGEDQIRIWVAGVTVPEGVWVQLPQELRAWSLYSGATFDVVATDGDLGTARFEFQPKSYLNPDEWTAKLA